MISAQRQAYAEKIMPLEAARPLCVDLDGTLVKSDTLVESLLLLVRTNPWQALQAPLWLFEGKAVLKAKVTSLVILDVEHLPYNTPLLAYLLEQREEGRELYLTTGADHELAKRVAGHLGIFMDVLASDGTTNLTGEDKLARLQRRFKQGFDYIGNARPDLPLLAAAGAPMLANPSHTTSAQLRKRNIAVTRTFEDRRPLLQSMLKAVRPHQWAKNLLVLVPLILSHSIKLHAVAQVLLAFVCLCLCASASYVINDLLDIEADRRHPKKRFRPFASGDLAASTGLWLARIFFAGAFALAYFLPRPFTGWLLLYTAATLAYSLYLKRVVLLDVIILSGLYTLRLLAGAAAAQVRISPWLAGFAVFLFLSLAMVKRFSELQNNRAQGQVPSIGRGYTMADVEQLRTFGSASAYAGMVIFALYINSHEIITLYSHAARMWLIVPLMILWISRVWLLAGRGLLDEDPVIFAVTDRMSLLIGSCVALVAFLAL
jgi:4-hydroxybenzoate polyprenyltransferase